MSATLAKALAHAINVSFTTQFLITAQCGQILDKFALKDFHSINIMRQLNQFKKNNV